MGATNINQTIIGKDLRTAYDNACSEATREFGHDPYNGTISTSHGATEFTPKLGRVTLGKFIGACWELTYCDTGERAQIAKRLLPERLRPIAQQIADVLNDSKFGTWACIKMPYTSAARVRQVNGLKGKRVHVWVACGWASM